MGGKETNIVGKCLAFSFSRVVEAAEAAESGWRSCDGLCSFGRRDAKIFSLTRIGHTTATHAFSFSHVGEAAASGWRTCDHVGSFLPSVAHSPFWRCKSDYIRRRLGRGPFPSVPPPLLSICGLFAMPNRVFGTSAVLPPSPIPLLMTRMPSRRLERVQPRRTSDPPSIKAVGPPSL